jgi:hypothetical protein
MRLIQTSRPHDPVATLAARCGLVSTAPPGSFGGAMRLIQMTGSPGKPSATFSGAMRLIQTSRPHDPVAPVSAAPGWRRDAPYPDFPTAQPRSPGKRSATGDFPGWRRDAPYPDFPTAQPRSPGKRSATGRPDYAPYPDSPTAQPRSPGKRSATGRAAAGDRAPISGGSAKTGVRVQNPGW